jgi:hypothetical protein
MAWALGRKPASERRATENTPDAVSIDQAPGIVERLISLVRAPRPIAWKSSSAFAIIAVLSR